MKGTAEWQQDKSDLIDFDSCQTVSELGFVFERVRIVNITTLPIVRLNDDRGKGQTKITLGILARTRTLPHARDCNVRFNSLCSSRATRMSNRFTDDCPTRTNASHVGDLLISPGILVIE